MKLGQAVLFSGLAFLLSWARAEEAAEKTVSWREKYTLGPGDIMDVGLYGHPELDRSHLFVQPDGTISYLQAQNIRAGGLTVDELREQMQAKLAESYKNPRVMISPVELRSKKYFILGKVVDNGVFSMDRPMTILEAVARSRGIETGLFESNTVELADLERSFLARGGKRVEVDFQKLFFEGDMSQNVQLEPGDYLYFPSAISNEIYVLGQVVSPGVLGFSNKLTVLGAIARREGFTTAAYREKVLVVRGSLKKPQLFVVDTNEVLKGRGADFLLQPKDIVYVSSRPWKYAEDLFDSAVGAFIESAVTVWTGANVGPFITNPLLPKAQIR